MIDLHMHSVYSDGTAEIIDILKQAEDLKLSTISITDHETINAYNEIYNIDIKKYFSGKIIPGIELKMQYKNKIIDVLGYGIDYKKMREFLKERYGESGRAEIQIKQLNDFYEYGRQYGLVLSPMEELVWDKEREWASIVFYDEMKKHEENKLKVPSDLWEDFICFKKKYYNKEGEMFYIDRAKYYPLMEDMLEVIHKSEGLAFVAHIYEYGWMKDKLEELKNMISNFKIDGVECYYSKFTNEQINGLVEFCKENNLFMSGGTDYHGDNRPEIEIGIGKGELKVPYSIISNWMDKVNIIK